MRKVIIGNHVVQEDGTVYDMRPEDMVELDGIALRALREMRARTTDKLLPIRGHKMYAIALSGIVWSLESRESLETPLVSGRRAVQIDGMSYFVDDLMDIHFWNKRRQIIEQLSCQYGCTFVPIPGYEMQYGISTCGKVVSLLKYRTMMPRSNSDGHAFVTLKNEITGIFCRKYISDLIEETFSKQKMDVEESNANADHNHVAENVNGADCIAADTSTNDAEVGTNTDKQSPSIILPWSREFVKFEPVFGLLGRLAIGNV